FSPSPFDEQLRRSAESLLMDESTLRAQVMEWMVHRPGKWIARSRRTDLLEELVAFHEQGGKLAVVSDYPARAKLDALGISSLFDVVVASGEHQQLRRLKPAPDGYLLAASELGVSPEDCVVLGDRLDADGQAAEHAGMKFRWIR